MNDDGALKVGVRVSTPDGPGTIVSYWFDHTLRGHIARTSTHVVVELDEGNHQWRRIYPPGQLRVIYAEAS